MTDATMNTTEAPDSAAPVIDPRQRVIAAEQHCADLRAKLQRLVAERGRARGVLADAIASWQGMSNVSHEQNARQYIKHEVSERQRLAQFGPDAASQPTPANSAIDRASVYSAGGNASDFARKQMRAGFRRGSFPGAMKGGRIPPRV